MMRVHTAVLAALLATPALTCPAFAEDTDPRAVLQASDEAVREAEGFAARFRLIGEGSEMIRSTMPSIDGRLYFGRTDDGRVLHAVGEAKDRADGEARPFDVVRTTEKLTWTDHDREAISTRRATPEPRDAPTAARLLHMVSLLKDNPFADLLERAESIEYEGVRDVGGVACDVVMVRLPSAQPGQARTGQGGHTAERWFIAQSDRLPRRFEQVTDAGMIRFSLVTELTGLQPGAQPAERLDVSRPEGYTVDDRTAARTEQPRTVTRAVTDAERVTEEQRPAERTTAPARPQNPNAPAFAFTPDRGSEVTNATQQGRVTVLYFWGTWCIPCRAVSPKISELAAKHADAPVDVFAPAIRERDPDAPRAYLSENEYKHRLVLGVDNLARTFSVRVYPTIVVIDAEGRIAYTGHPSGDRPPEKLAQEVNQAVEKALAGL